MELPVKYTSLTWQEKKAVREQYVKIQDGKCYFCKEDINQPAPKKIINKRIDWDYFPESFLKYPIHLQHNHETDMTEGAVHNYCNAVMWQYHNK